MGALSYFFMGKFTLQKRIERGWGNRGGELSFRGDDVCVRGGEIKKEQEGKTEWGYMLWYTKNN